MKKKKIVPLLTGVLLACNVLSVSAAPVSGAPPSKPKIDFESVDFSEQELESLPTYKRTMSKSPDTQVKSYFSMGTEALTVGDEFTVSDITYKITSDSEPFEVEAYYAPMRLLELNIPSTVAYNDVTYQVTSIPKGAFYGNYKTLKIVLPEGLRTVGISAFQGCNAVKELVLPSTLETFTTMGFPSLEAITLPESNPTFQLIDGVLFSKDGTKLYLYPSKKAGTTYTIPATTTRIVDSAFYYNQCITSLTLPDSVTVVEPYAFDSVQAMQHFTYGSNVATIGEFNLSVCPNLEDIVIRGSAKIGPYSINECPKLTQITIDGPIKGYSYYAFYNLPSLLKYVTTDNSSYSSRDGVLYNGNRLVRYPSGKAVTTFIVPETTTEIAGLAFNYMTTTDKIVLPQHISLITMAFHYPNVNAPIDIYFQDEEMVTLSTESSGVFVGLTNGSHIYLKNDTVLANFSTYPKAINPVDSVSVEIDSFE